MMCVIVASVVLFAASSLALPGSHQRQFSIENIPTVLTNNGLTTLVDSVVKAGLAEALSGAGPFTVFAPTNDAFGAVDPSTLNSILNDVEILKNVLTYHVVASALVSSSIENELTPRSLAGENLRINVYGSGNEAKVTINGALRLKTLEASNGIIYVIDKVLVPEPESNIVKVLEKKGIFSTLLTAFKITDLTSTVESAGPFTLFAPTDDAFKALPPGALDSLIANPEELKKILLTHVVSGTVYSRGLASGAVPVVAGGNVDAVVARNGVTIGNAEVIDADLFASNGVIHVINSVILRSADEAKKAAAIQPIPTDVNIPSVLTENGLTTLVDLVVKADLANALSGAGPFTVFAPTNDAFNSVDPATLNALLQDVDLLKRVLTYHVVGSALPPASIQNELVTKSLAGESLRVNTYNNGKVVTINGALKLKALEASNGIIYVIDKVLVPDNDKSIVKVLASKGKFTTLITAFNVAGLKTHLDTAGPFTLFAPTDDAFAALPEGALDSLIANPRELKKILLSHVIPSSFFSRGISSGQLNLARGGSVGVTVNENGVKIADADVIEADIAASNGVIHVINRVL
uniref:Fasciclin domain-containing protein n=2 Tax=Daphnia magna TaxID=35525 RepID=A0A0P5HBI0_9CRUS